MAEKVGDSDSDEYEIMNPGALVAASVEGFQSQQQLQQMQDLLVQQQQHEQQLRKQQQQTQQEQKQQKPKKKEKGKKRGMFRRFSRGKKTQAAAPDLSNSKAEATEPMGKSLPPKLGPKPPRKLSDEEVLHIMREKQKSAVAAAREDRLRRASESNVPGPEKYSRSQAMEYHPGYTVDKSYGEMDVKDILSKYSNHLPLKVLVSKGVYGMEERYSLATSDKCVIHFIKKRELVQIKDPKTNTEFSVPVNSAIKFGVVYNPHNDESEAMKGLEFQYVSDILAEPKLPKMGMAALKDPDVVGMKSMEVLVIHEVIFSENPLDPRLLRVYSLTAKCYRDIPETQEIKFRTTPSLMQLYLPDILKHVTDPCPMHVAMFRNPLGRPLVAPGIPNSMFRRSMYLKKRYVDILLIATGCSETEGEAEAFEIPTDIDVEFEVIKCSPEERERLGEESRKLQEKLTKANKNIRYHRYVGMTDEQHRLQQSLYKSVREGEEPTQSTDVDDDYVRATSGNRLAMEHRVELLEENMKRCSHSLAEAKATIAVISNENQALTEKVKCLEDTIVDYRRTQVTVETIERQLDRIYTELDELREEGNNLRNGGGVAKLPFAPKANASEESGGVANTETLPLKFKDESPPTTGSVDVAKPEPPLTTDPLPTTDLAGSRGSAKTKAISPAITGDIVAESQAHERNKMLLSNMRKVEVSRLLSSAGLGQYAEMMSSEGVSGDILAECTEEMLEGELGVTSKLHRLKLLRIIEGKAPVEWYKLVD